MEYSIAVFVFSMIILFFIFFVVIVARDAGYRQGQLDYHKGTIKYTFTNEVVAVEK